MRQCNTYSTKEQYDRSMVLLAQWLSLENTIFVLGGPLIDHIKFFQAQHIMPKEQHLAHHIRKSILMCADAMTTSPVESMNHLTKNTMGIGANLNLSTSVVAMIEDHSRRYESHVNKMLLEMDGTNLHSKATTKDHVHRRCQQLIDKQHDKYRHEKCIQLSCSEWNCWNFIDPERECKYYFQREADVINDVGIDEVVLDVHEKIFIDSMILPEFLNVYRLILTRFEGKAYLKCSCRHFER